MVKKIKRKKSSIKNVYFSLIRGFNDFRHRANETIDDIDELIYRLIDEHPSKYQLQEKEEYLSVYVVENSNRNEIECRLFEHIKQLLKSSISRDVKVELVNDMHDANLILFSISEHLSEQAINLLKHISVKKIGIVTSGAARVDLKGVNQLTIVSQSVDNQLADKYLLSMFNARHAKLVRLPLSYMLDVKRDPSTMRIYQVDYHQTLFEFGLLTLMAYALPSRYSHLMINCQNESQATMVANTIKTDSIKISNVGSTVAIQVNQPKSTWSNAVKAHGEMQLLHAMRKVLENG